MPQLEVFICERGPIDAVTWTRQAVSHAHTSFPVWCLTIVPTSAAVARGEVSPLDHEILDDSVELGPFVAVAFLQKHTSDV